MNKLIKLFTSLVKADSSVQIGNKLLANVYIDSQLIPFRNGNKWGFCTEDLKVVINCIYDSVELFSEGLSVVKIKNSYGAIDKAGKQVIPPTYSSAFIFSDGLAAVNSNGKYGYIDLKGKTVIPFVYDGAEHFSEGIAVVRKEGNYGYINTVGKEIVSCYCNEAWPFSNGLGLVNTLSWDNVNPESLQMLYNYFDKNGLNPLNGFYHEARSFSENIAFVKINDKWGFVVFKDGKFSFSSYQLKNNETAFQLFEDVGDFHEGFAKVMLDGLWGYLDKNNRFLTIKNIPDKIEIVLGEVGHSYGRFIEWDKHFNFEGACNFSDGMAKVKMDDKWGFIDNSGELTIKCQFDKDMVDNFFEDPYDQEAYIGFSEGFAKVKLNGSFGFIDKKGNEILPFEFEDAKSFSCGFAAIKKNSKWGYVDSSGNEIIPCIYDDAKSFSGNLAEVQSSGRWGFINSKGTQFWKD